MKLLIGGKSRNIYMRKDGSAYYKSGGEKVDASYMFKKNGDLKKQYSENVKQTHRIKKNKKFYGGVDPIQFTFKAINFNSDSAGNKRKELLKLLQIAYNVVLERRIYRDEDYNNTIVDKDYNNFLINLLYVLQYYELKKKTNIGTLKTRIKALEKGDDSVKTYLNYYTQIKQLFTPLSPEESNKDTDILSKLHSLTDTLFIRTETTDSVIDTMFDNIKNIIDEVSGAVTVELEHPTSRVGSKNVSTHPEASLPMQSADSLSSPLESIPRPAELNSHQPQQLHGKLHGRLTPPVIPTPSLGAQVVGKPQQQQQQQLRVEQQQLEQQLKQQQLELVKKEKQLEQLEQLKKIKANLDRLTTEFLQRYDLNPKDYFNSLDSIIRQKITIMELIKQEINTIKQIFEIKLGNEKEIMSQVILAEEKVLEIRTNVQKVQTKIRELQQQEHINKDEHNKIIQSKTKLQRIITNTFELINSIKAATRS